MMTVWYYGSSMGQHGPVPEAELRRLILQGTVGPETMVWKEGMEGWRRVDEVPELLASGYAAPMPEAVYGMGMSVAPSPGLAVAALVCGIIGMVSCYVHALLGIPAVICGHMALSKIRKAPVPMEGKGMAVAGLIMGYLSIALSVGFAIFFAFVVSSVMKASSRARPLTSPPAVPVSPLPSTP